MPFVMALVLRSQASKETILSLLSYAREDALRFFDINIRQSYYSKELIATLLHKANVFKVNDEELVLLRSMCDLEGTDEEVCRKMLRKYNLRYVILTAGSAFSSIYSPDEQSTIPTPKVQVVDTVGAGDSFLRGVCLFYINRKSCVKPISLLSKRPLSFVHRKGMASLSE